MDQYELSEKLKSFYNDKLNFCGCGRPEDTMLFIKELLNVMDNRFDKYSYEEFQNKIREVFQFENRSVEKQFFTNIQNGIIQFVFYQLDNVGILEHGGSIGGSWLSDEGKELLALLNQVEDFETIMD